MASDIAMSSLAAAEQESSTSALPTTSTAAAEGATTSQSLFDPLFEAKNSLTHQSEAPAQLHPLNSSLQSLYSASSSDGRLSRDEYRQLIAQLRHSVSQFAATTPALKSHSPSSSSTSTSDQLRRYISLLTETSKHTAALAHSIAPLKSADRQRSNAKADPSLSSLAAPFPQQLSIGSLASSSTAQPTSSWEAAIQTLAALCETLDSTAKTLGLETFLSPRQMQQQLLPIQPQPRHSHTYAHLGCKDLGHRYRAAHRPRLCLSRSTPKSQVEAFLRYRLCQLAECS